MAYTTIDNPELYFQTEIYTGNGTDGRTITLSGSEDMQPDFVWIKNRGQTDNHHLFDSVRGVNKALSSSTTNAESDAPSSGYVSGFASDGFTVTSGSSADDNVNKNTETYVSWNWKESATAGFDIVSYAGDGQSNREVSHGLSAVPKTMWIKNRSGSHAWMVYHDGLGYNSGSVPRFLQFDNTNAQNNGGSGDFPADPTSSVFKVGSYDTMNKNGDNIVAYVFTEKKGFSKFGSFVGNGNADGPFVYTGFKPAFLLTKKATESSEWHIYDNKREPYNVRQNVLSPNANYADSINANCNTDFLSNGFKLRNNNDNRNDSGETHIYMAFAESPFVNSNGVPTNAA